MRGVRIWLCLMLMLGWMQADAGLSGVFPGIGRRAVREFNRAHDAWRLADAQTALYHLERAVERETEFLEAHLLRSEILLELHRFAEAAVALRQAVKLDRERFPESRYYLAYALLRSGSYADAKKHFLVFMDDQPGNELAEEAEKHLEQCGFALQAQASPVPFEPVNLGPGVNTRHAEYTPSLTADAKTLIFTRREPLEDRFGRSRDTENFYVSRFEDGRWGSARPLGPPVNTAENEGAQSLSVSGRELFFTACNRPGVLGRCDLYYAVRHGGSWSVPVNLGPVVNSTSWDAQPSISADGRSLYFASTRPGSIGPSDLWVASKDEEGQWEAPKNLGPVVNTRGRELSPFIHPDDQSLYFASDGHLGMGGLDLFVSRRDSAGQWTTPVNLGYPLNTHADEFALVVEATGRRAFFASDVEGGFGDLDIYSFELHAEARPRPVTYMRGRVIDASTGQPLFAGVELTDLQSGRSILQEETDPETGAFLTVLPLNRVIGLHVSTRGYLFFSEHFSYTDPRQATKPYVRDIALEPLQAGAIAVLRNVLFDTGSDFLRPESKTELHRLVRILDENPELRIEIHGHTDNVGSREYNMRLSEDRARRVRDYLLEQGIDPLRMHYKGFAYTRPVDTNETTEGRARNRRTEFVVVHP